MSAPRAHPRSRGENRALDTLNMCQVGSSPLTRGKPEVRVRRVERRGLIPAHAGKTPVHGRAYGSPWAHPRSRGENAVIDTLIADRAGSSPLTRGKPRTRHPEHVPGGLIPAHAGKTEHGFGDAPEDGAHPRSRGENSKENPAPPKAAGSSPLTRGKHFLTCAFIAQIDQILESLELCAFSESYSSQDVYATDAPRDRVRSIGLAPRSSRGAS